MRPRKSPRVPSATFAAFAFLVALFAVPAVAPGLASADVGQRLPRLTRLSEEVVRGGMPLGYVPLRQLWLEWDQGDPIEVEESLHALAGDRRLAAPLAIGRNRFTG